METNTKEITLSNGTKVLYTRKFGDPFFSMAIGFKVGKINESDTNRGISHFIEHMCFNGTEKHTKEELMEIPYKYGGSFNASTGEMVTDYTIQVLKEYHKESIDLLTQLALFPTFPTQYLEKEKSVVIEELRGYEDDSVDVAFNLSSSAQLDDRLKHPILGYEETIEGYTLEMVKEYHNKYYNTANLVISICSDMDEDYLIEVLEDMIPFKEGELSENFKFDLRTEKYVEDSKIDIQQGILIHKMDFDKEDDVVIQVLNRIYGQGMNSRLFKRIREEKGLCYSVGSFTQIYHNSNTLYTYVSFSELDRKDEIIEEINVILNEMIVDLKDSEIKMAKIQSKKTMFTQLEGSSFIANSKPRKYFKGENLNPINTVDSINKVTKEDVIELLKKISVESNQSVAFLNRK